MKKIMLILLIIGSMFAVGYGQAQKPDPNPTKTRERIAFEQLVKDKPVKEQTKATVTAGKDQPEKAKTATAGTTKKSGATKRTRKAPEVTNAQLLRELQAARKDLTDAKNEILKKEGETQGLINGLGTSIGNGFTAANNKLAELTVGVGTVNAWLTAFSVNYGFTLATAYWIFWGFIWLIIAAIVIWIGSMAYNAIQERRRDRARERDVNEQLGIAAT